jgi:hypothetical protein|tara:strand:- start:296 stop:619 length:324 start_codon:yes stop_codon:yes gene_type:complete
LVDLVPFDPKKHKPISTVGGRTATEYLISETAPDGGAWNIPQIWFDSKTNKPKLLTGDKAWNEAADYEKKTGKKFPRFESIDKAVEVAKKRSKGGGATKKSLLKPDG